MLRNNRPDHTGGQHIGGVMGPINSTDDDCTMWHAYSAQSEYLSSHDRRETAAAAVYADWQAQP